MPTNGVFVSIKMIQKLINTYLTEKGKLYFLFDNASSGEVWRKNLDPDYKINRHRQDPGFYRGLDFLQILLIHYENDWCIIQCPAYEADDLVAPVLTEIPKGDKVGIVSNDLDWARALSEDVAWIRAGRKEGEYIYDEIDSEIFKSLYGFHPSLKNVCIYKSLRGDRIDNIGAGVKNISKKMILSILNQVKTIEDLFDSLEDLDIPKHLKRLIADNKERILLNYTLVDYRPISIQAGKDVTVASRFNPRVLKMLYSTLKFDIEKIDIRLAKFYKHSKLESSEDFKFEFSDYGRV
jgi:5'-3' exonuclease